MGTLSYALYAGVYTINEEELSYNSEVIKRFSLPGCALFFYLL
jgi:hypothetical protein